MGNSMEGEPRSVLEEPRCWEHSQAIPVVPGQPQIVGCHGPYLNACRESPSKSTGVTIVS